MFVLAETFPEVQIVYTSRLSNIFKTFHFSIIIIYSVNCTYVNIESNY